MTTAIEPLATHVPEKGPKAITLATWPTIATKLAAVVPSLRFKLTAAHGAFLNDASVLAVIDGDTCVLAGTALVAVKRLRRAVETHYETIKRPFNALVSTIRDCEKADMRPLEIAETLLDGRIVKWRREKQARERERLETAQSEADERAKAEHDRQVAAMQRVADQTPDPALRAILTDEASTLADAPIAVETVSIETEIPIVPGLSFSQRHRGELQTNVALLTFVKAIAKKTVPLVAVLGLTSIKDRPGVYRSKWIDDQVRAHGGVIGLPGVTVVVDEGTTGR